jgi:hypothetical protein
MANSEHHACAKHSFGNRLASFLRCSHGFFQKNGVALLCKNAGWFNVHPVLCGDNYRIGKAFSRGCVAPIPEDPGCRDFMALRHVFPLIITRLGYAH